MSNGNFADGSYLPAVILISDALIPTNLSKIKQTLCRRLPVVVLSSSTCKTIVIPLRSINAYMISLIIFVPPHFSETVTTPYVFEE